MTELRMPWCQFFEPNEDGGPEYVQDVHEISVDDRPFFIPLPAGNAVRVSVCARHAARLYDLFPEIPRPEHTP